MTMPDERSYAVLKTRAFLRALIDKSATPGVPTIIRDIAYRCLRHYPGSYHINEAAKVAENAFGPLDSKVEEVLRQPPDQIFYRLTELKRAKKKPRKQQRKSVK
jgi:hypothetical protein